jgi:amidase
MAPLALGTDTDGSVIGPAGLCGVVGIKPEPSLLPLDGVCATSADQDAIGVLGLRVEDVLAALHELSGVLAEPISLPSMTDLRVGLWQIPRVPPLVREAMDLVAAELAAAGVSTVPFELAVDQQLLIDGMLSLTSGFRPMIEAYLATRPGAPGTLDELIAANADDAIELALFGQDLFEQAALISEGERRESWPLAERVRTAAVGNIELALFRYGIDAILAPSNEPAWRVDYELGDPFPLSSSSPSSLARFPNLSMPISAPGDLPIGISIFGPPTVRELAPIALCLERLCSSARQFIR